MSLQARNVYELLRSADAERPAIVDLAASKTLTYKELLREVDGFSLFIANEYKLKKGDRVSIFLPNSWQYVVSLYSVLKLGCIAVPIDYRSTEIEVAEILRDSGSSLLICESERAVKIGHEKICVSLASNRIQSSSERLELAEPEREDAACILYTGGTTGKQKGALLSHGNFIAVLSGLSQVWQARRGGEVFLQFLPMTHSGGLNCGLNSSIFTSGTTIIMRRFDADLALEAVESYRVTAMPAVPTVYVELLRSDKINSSDLSSLRICFCSGAFLSRAIAERFKEKTGIAINVGWGLTEASPQLTVCPLGVYEENFVGYPLPNTLIKAFDTFGRELPAGAIGELGAKGPQIMMCYWKREQETRSSFTDDGFLLTGDIGYVTRDSSVYLLGRKKNMINTGGYKVWPEEVESVIIQHPKVKEVAVVGVPDEKYGEVVLAFVVPSDKITEEEIIVFCKERISSFKIPKRIVFRDSLPKSSVGKVLHRLLKEELLQSNKNRSNSNN